MKKIIASLVLVLFATLGAMASNSDTDSDSEEGKVNVVIGEQGNEADVEKAFSDNVPEDKSLDGMPHFAIVGKYKRFYLGIGTNFKALGAFDWGAEMQNITDFVPSSMTPTEPGNGAQTRFSMQASSIYLNFVAMPDNPNKTSLFFSGNFKGNNNGFKMSHFYIKYKGVKMGYTHSSFTDNNSVPFVFDDQGPLGQASIKLASIVWIKEFDKGFSTTVGLDAPSINMTEDTTFVRAVNQRMPSIPLCLQYENSSAHVRLSGLLRLLQYHDIKAQQNENKIGWGTQLTASYSPMSNFKLYGGTVYGKGISRYIQDCTGLQLDIVNENSNPSQYYTLPVWSYHAGLEFNFSEKIQSNLVYSSVNCLYDDRKSVSETNYYRGQYLTANLLYNVNYFVKMGVEYNWGYRKTCGNKVDQMNRIECMFFVEI